MDNLPENSRRMREELDDLFAPAKAAYKELVTEWQRRANEVDPSKPFGATHEELVSGWRRREEEVYTEIRERFEQGGSSGKYPTLSELLSQLTEAKKEEFFRTGGRRPLRRAKPQKRHTDEEPYSGAAGSMKSLPTPDERIFEELDEVFGFPEKASFKYLARLWNSWERCNEVWARFERGQASGKFPILSEFLSDLSNEEKEKFFRTGGMQAIFPLEERQEKPWDGDPYHGDSDWYRDDLYAGIHTSGDPEHLTGLAVEWLEELAREGYQGVTVSYFGDGVLVALPAKQKTSSKAIPEPLRMNAKAGPAFLGDGHQVLWLELEVGRSERGHREINLNDEPLRTDTAILASLMAMECRPVDLDRVRTVLATLPRPMEVPFWKQRMSSLGQELPHPRTLDFAMMLLRYHKPAFDQLSEAERVELLERACGHINEFLSTLYRVAAFLDYGVPGRQLRSAKGEAEKHIEAAVLKHVYGLSTMEVARQMGEPVAQKQKNKNDPATVRQWVRRGTQLMVNAMGEKRWWAHVEAMKAEAERWNKLTEEEQEAEETLEAYAEARRIRLDWAREEVEQGDDPLKLSAWEKIRLKAAREARQWLNESRVNPRRCRRH